MFDIKELKKFCPKEVRSEVTDFASLKKEMHHEIDGLRKKGILKDVSTEIKARMEWLRARNRLSEISLSLTIVSVVLSVITAMLSLLTKRCGAGNLEAGIWVMIVLAVVSGDFSIITFFMHKSDCRLLAYYTIKLELIEEEISKENEKVYEKEEQKLLEISSKVVKCKRGCRCIRHRK